MPTSTTAITNAIVNTKNGPTPRLTAGSRKPFVVTSVATRRYVPAQKPTVQKPPPPIPPPPPTRERTSGHRRAPTKQASRSGPLSTATSKVQPPRPSLNAIAISRLNATARVQKPQPLTMGPSANQSSCEKTFEPKPLKLVQRLKLGKLVDGCPAPAPVSRHSMQDTKARKLPPRPSCVPRAPIHQSSVGVSGVPVRKQGVTSKASATGPRISGVVSRKPPVNIDIDRTARHVKDVGVSIKKPVVAGNRRTGTSTRNGRLITPESIVDLQEIKLAAHIDWSPPPSPDLSPFPSQSWTIAVDADDAKQINIRTPTTTCGDGTLASAGEPGVTGMHNDSSEPSESATASPTLPSPPAAMETLTSPTQPTIELDGTTKISAPTKESSAEVSYANSGVTIISPSRNGRSSSTATLAKVMNNQTSPPTEDSEINRTRTAVQSAIELARAFLAGSAHVSQPTIGTAPPKVIGANVSRIRKLFIPALDEGAKASKNPMTQMEIEMLRARKKVAGGGVVDPRLDRLNSLCAMAIVTKLRSSDPNSPSQV